MRMRMHAQQWSTARAPPLAGRTVRLLVMECGAVWQGGRQRAAETGREAAAGSGAGPRSTPLLRQRGQQPRRSCIRHSQQGAAAEQPALRRRRGRSTRAPVRLGGLGGRGGALGLPQRAFAGSRGASCVPARPGSRRVPGHRAHGRPQARTPAARHPSELAVHHGAHRTGRCSLQGIIKQYKQYKPIIKQCRLPVQGQLRTGGSSCHSRYSLW